MARGKSNHTTFHKIMGNLEKMQAIGDIISYFFPYYFNCHTKKSTQKKSTGGKYMIFFSLCVFIFSGPLGHAIIVILSQTVYWGENMARGKSNHTMFHKIMGNLEKMQAIGDIISYSTI
jgi:hypothetical protein